VVVHDALRPAGRPGRVVDRDHVVLGLEPGLDLAIRPAIDERFELLIERDAADARGRALEQRGELATVEDRGGAGVLEYVADLLGAEARIDRDQDAARLRHGEVGQVERLAVDCQERDAIVFLKTVLAQR
jgi:hypothetical protein